MTPEKEGAAGGAKPGKVSTTKIDALIAAAHARNKRSVTADPETVKKLADAKDQSKAAEAARAAARALRESARGDRKAQREKDSAERASKRAERKAAVEAKRAERDANRAAKAAMKGKKAPELTGSAKDAYEMVATLELTEIAAVHAALGTLVKSRSIGAVGKIAEADRPEPGDHVRITGGEHAGKTGYVSKAQRIRCFVDIEGLPEGKKKNVYLYISQVEVLPDSAAKKATKPATEPAAPADATSEPVA
jgi:hypothetical protein